MMPNYRHVPEKLQTQKERLTNCLIDPASEFYVHRQWFDKTAGAGIYSRQFQI
jgi:hypothetical protein